MSGCSSVSLSALSSASSSALTPPPPNFFKQKKNVFPIFFVILFAFPHVVISLSALVLYLLLTSCLLIPPLAMSSVSHSILSSVTSFTIIVAFNLFFLFSVIIFFISLNLLFVTFTYVGSIT